MFAKTHPAHSRSIQKNTPKSGPARSIKVRDTLTVKRLKMAKRTRKRPINIDDRLRFFSSWILDSPV